MSGRGRGEEVPCVVADAAAEDYVVVVSVWSVVGGNRRDMESGWIPTGRIPRVDVAVEMDDGNRTEVCVS